MKHRLIVCVVLLLLLLTGCGAANVEPISVESIPSTSVVSTDNEWYTVEADLSGLGYETSLLTEEDLGGNALVSDGQVLLVEETGEGNLVTLVHTDGSTGASIALTAPREDKSLSMIQLNQESLYCVYVCSEEDQEGYRATWQWVQKYSMQGELLWQKPIHEMLGIEENDQTLVDILAVNGKLIVATDKEIYFLNEDGNVQIQIDSPGESPELCLSSQGDVYIEDAANVYQLNVETQTVGEPLFSLSNGEQLYTGAGSYDFLLMNDARLRGVNLEQHCITELTSWIECDLYASVAGVVYLDENQYGIAVYKSPAGATQMLCLSFLPQENIQEKQSIWMAVPATDPDCWSDALSTKIVYAINAFNRTDPDYRLEIATYDSDETLQLMMTTEMPPDIIVFGSNLTENAPSEQLYEAKGYLVDLNEYLESDPELQKSDFLPNLLEAFCATNGHLYNIVTEFQVETEYIATEYAANVTDWSIENVYEIMKSMPDGSCFVDSGYTDLALEFLLTNCVDEFVNVEEHSCEFQSQAFYDLLYLCRDYCGTGNPVLSNSVLLDKSISSSLSEGLSLNSSGIFVGYPGVPGNGSVISCAASFSMVVTSQVKAGGWKFLRTLLLKDFQNEWTGTMFPVRKDSFNYCISLEQNRNPEIDAREYEILAEMVEGACYRKRLDSPVIAIVQEEASAFFVGDKSAEEVAAIIQNRVQIYLSEQT